MNMTVCHTLSLTPHFRPIPLPLWLLQSGTPQCAAAATAALGRAGQIASLGGRAGCCPCTACQPQGVAQLGGRGPTQGHAPYRAVLIFLIAVIFLSAVLILLIAASQPSPARHSHSSCDSNNTTVFVWVPCKACGSAYSLGCCATAQPQCRYIGLGTVLPGFALK